MCFALDVAFARSQPLPVCLHLCNFYLCMKIKIGWVQKG